MQQSRLYVFGPFMLDCSRRALARFGEPVALSSRGFDILRVLVEARDRVVSRAELLQQVWPGVAVEEHNLSVQMSKLRRALGDAGDTVIATVPGRGYQFVGELAPASGPRADKAADEAADEVGDGAGRPAETASSVEAAPTPQRRRAGWRRPALLAGAAVLLAAAAAAALLRPPDGPARLSIVVMPFRDLSDAPGSRYIADAITDDLTTELAGLPGSLVISRETADSYQGRPVPAAAVGRALGVRYLLEGSVRAEDAALHINAQLIDTASSAHLWARRFDAPRSQLARTRDEIVALIAGGLDRAMTQAELAHGARERPHDPDAEDLFLRARSILDHDDTLAGYRSAQALLERAVAKRPDFADAQALLGGMLLRKLRSNDDPDDQTDFAEATKAIDRALALAPDNVAALAARAHAELIDEHFTEAAYSARAALSGNPNDIEAQEMLAGCAAAEGRLDEAARALETLQRLDPESAKARERALRLGFFRLLQGRLPEAQDWLHRAIAGQTEPVPGTPAWGRAEGARLLLIAAAELGGRTAEARALYAAFDAAWPHRTTWRIAALTWRRVAALPGYRAMLGALQSAGMPAYADEHGDDHLAGGHSPLPDTDYEPTPLGVDGATTIDTPALARLVRDGTAGVIVDLGSGAAVITGAAWKDEASILDDAGFVDAVLRDGKADQPIVVMSDGTYGAASYNAALRLGAPRGWAQKPPGRRVLWYRGGEEAWSAAGLPATDRRQ